MKPTVGRVVHYHILGLSPEVNERAAIITLVNDNGTVDLALINPTGISFLQRISMGGPDGASPTPGCWNWPPRDE